MKLRCSICLIFLLLATASIALAAEITGKVREASGSTATVAIDGDASPAVGDSVEIFFKLAGGNEEISVATGKVASVEAKVAKITIENATGTVAPDQLVRIKSAGSSKAPVQSPAATAAGSSSIVGDWTTKIPDGPTVSFSFKPDGTLLWVIDEGEFAKSTDGKYRLDSSTQPQSIELSDLQEGEMKGIRLRGIFELQSDGRLKLDFRRDEAPPPKEFSEQALALSKTTSPVVRPNKPSRPTPTPEPTSTPYVAPTPSVEPTVSPDKQLIEEAKQHYDRDDEAGALEALEKAIMHNPKSADAYFWRGVWTRTKDPTAAIADFEKAMELNPNLKLQELIDAEKAALKGKDRTKPPPTRAKKKSKP